MNNPGQNLNTLQNFKMRFLVKESTQQMTSSWCSTLTSTSTIKSKPVLQYALDGVTWIDVLTEVEKDLK